MILAEEWHTVHAVLHLDGLLRREGLRDRVTLFWNANNGFGFDRIDWSRLAAAATLTTVSHYMKQCMLPLGVDPAVVPNGISAEVFLPVRAQDLAQFHGHMRGRAVLAKIARFDPDKRWISAIEIVSELKRRGRRPLLIARGGAEAHGAEVLRRASEYSVPDRNALVVRTDSAHEFASVFLPVHESPAAAARLRRAGRATARDYTWVQVLERCLLPRIGSLAGVCEAS